MAKNRKDLKAGVGELKEVWDTKIEKHLDEMEGKSNQHSGLGVILAILPHILSLSFVVFVIWTAKPASSLFSWHPTLMSLAFVFFMSEALLTFSPWFSLIPSYPRDNKLTWHRALNACCTFSAYGGLGVIIYNKYINNWPHFTSWHGFLGIIVCCTLAVQASGGVIAMNPSLLPFKIKRVILKRMHAFSGTVIFTGAMVTLTLAMYTTWFSANVDNSYIWGACCACPVILFSTIFVQFIKNRLF